MSGAVLMTDGTGAPGPYSQTPYKLVTTNIESVNGNQDKNRALTYSAGIPYRKRLFRNCFKSNTRTIKAIFKYLMTLQQMATLWDLATNVQEGISPDLRPDPAIVWNGSSQVIYKFSLPSVVTFSRKATAWTGAADWYLMGSDDGVTWYSAAQTISGIPGPYPDETYPRAYADRPYTYYIFSYTWGQGGSQLLTVTSVRCMANILDKHRCFAHLPWRCKHQPRPAVFPSG